MPVKAYSYDGRPNSTIALLIAATAYQLTIDNIMPEIPYLTYLDKFNMFSFLTMMTVALESMAVLRLAANNEDNENILEYWDNLGAMIIVAVWIAGCIHFALLGFHLRMRELLKLNLSYKDCKNFQTFYEGDSHDRGRLIVRAKERTRCPNVLFNLESEPKQSFYRCYCMPWWCICRLITRILLCKMKCGGIFCCWRRRVRLLTVAETKKRESTGGIEMPRILK